MKTYQDLLGVGANELQRAEFCKNAIAEFKNSIAYMNARAGEAYYAKHNLTIEAYQKTLRTISGREVADVFSANYKLKTLHFRRLVLQQVNYVLGNGIYLSKQNNKAKLGKDIDHQLLTLAKRAMAGGVAFGFWNLDHLEVFAFADTASKPGFCPLYDEKTSKLRAGVRFWFRKVGDNEILRCTLYEEDGYTEYKIIDNEAGILEPKRAYIINKSVLADGTIEETIDQNYGALPIIPLYANDTHESELVGMREDIDCYDFVKSGFANNIDDASEIFWILKNTGGMDDVDIAQFMQRLRSVHAAAIDGDQGVDATAQTLNIPTEARTKMLEILRKDIYEDFQALDVNTLSASAKTTQEIQAAYQNQDNKCADFEYELLEFLHGILALAGIDDEPTFRWNKVVNQAEQTNMILTAANYLTDEAIIKHLPFLTPEEAEDIIKERNTEAYKAFNEPEEDDEDGGQTIEAPENGENEANINADEGNEEG